MPSFWWIYLLIVLFILIIVFESLVCLYTALTQDNCLYLPYKCPFRANESAFYFPTMPSTYMSQAIVRNMLRCFLHVEVDVFDRFLSDVLFPD